MAEVQFKIAFLTSTYQITKISRWSQPYQTFGRGLHGPPEPAPRHPSAIVRVLPSTTISLNGRENAVNQNRSVVYFLS